MAVVASATGAAVFGLSGVAAGVAGGALLGAGAGALYSGITGDGNILNSALTGGLIGGGIGGLGAAFAPAGATSAAGIGGGGAFAPAAGSGANFIAPTAAQVAGTANTPAMAAAALNSVPSAGATGTGLTSGAVDYALMPPVTQGASTVPSAGLSGKEALGYGLAGTAALSLLGGMNQPKLPDAPVDPGQVRPYTYTTKTNQAAFPTGPLYGADGLPIAPKPEQSYFTQSYEAGTPYTAANGGLMAIGGPVERMSQNVMGGLGNMYPQSQQVNTNFATPSQMPASSEIIRSDYDAKTQPYTGVMMAKGGKAKADDGFSFDDLTKEEKRYFLDLMASPMKGEMAPGSNVGPENSFEKYMMSQAPQGFTGRVGARRANDDGSNLRAGVSGIAMAQPGKHGVTAMPGAYDVGYTSARKSEEDPYFDLSAFRSINSVPGRGHEQGVNARYTMPFGEGGITYDDKTQKYSGLPQMGPAQVAEVPIVDTRPNVGGNPQNMLGGGMMNWFMRANGMLGDEQQGAFTPATSLYRGDIDSLTSQWQAANPYAKTYDPTVQKYGAGKPTNAQLLAFQNAQAEKAYQDKLNSFQAEAMPSYAMGGDVDGYNLGGYSDGGRLLKGPGDGVSDDIPAMIGDKQPARLADGEFVIPARIVSELGNGSTDAGAKRLYAMMDKIQAGRKKTIGKNNVAKDTKAKKHLLA